MNDSSDMSYSDEEDNNNSNNSSNLSSSDSQNFSDKKKLAQEDDKDEAKDETEKIKFDSEKSEKEEEPPKVIISEDGEEEEEKKENLKNEEEKKDQEIKKIEEEKEEEKENLMKDSKTKIIPEGRLAIHNNKNIKNDLMNIFSKDNPKNPISLNQDDFKSLMNKIFRKIIIINSSDQSFIKIAKKLKKFKKKFYDSQFPPNLNSLIKGYYISNNKNPENNSFIKS